MKRDCGTCGRTFEAKTGKAKFCSSSCRGKAHRSGASSSRVVLAMPARTSDESVSSAVRAELEAADRAHTPAGRMCLFLAGRIDSGPESSAGSTALTRELAARLDQALSGAEEAGDIVDELRAKRARRAAR